MGGLIVVEGLDGAGKRTLSAGLVEAWRAAAERESATLAFPRYGESIHADLGAEALRGTARRHRVESSNAMAVLLALDRPTPPTGLRNCSPPTTSCFSIATSPPTRRTRRPGTTKMPQGRRSTGYVTWSTNASRVARTRSAGAASTFRSRSPQERARNRARADAAPGARRLRTRRRSPAPDRRGVRRLAQRHWMSTSGRRGGAPRPIRNNSPFASQIMLRRTVKEVTR